MSEQSGALSAKEIEAILAEAEAFPEVAPAPLAEERRNKVVTSDAPNTEADAPLPWRLYAVMSREAVKKMNGVRGKMINQGGHAYLHAFWDAEERFPATAIAYRTSPRAYKITLAVDTDAELHALHEAYRLVCGVSLVTDAGLTVFKEPTLTCLGIGPIRVDMIGPDLAALRPFT